MSTSTRRRAGQLDRRHGGDRGVADGEDLVARADAGGAQRQHQRVGSAGDADGLARRRGSARTPPRRRPPRARGCSCRDSSTWRIGGFDLLAMGEKAGPRDRRAGCVRAARRLGSQVVREVLAVVGQRARQPLAQRDARLPAEDAADQARSRRSSRRCRSPAARPGRAGPCMRPPPPDLDQQRGQVLQRDRRLAGRD